MAIPQLISANAQSHNLEQQQITERLSKATEQLANHDILEVRLGGIYSLERIARDSEADQPTVVNLLATFVRETTKRGGPGARDSGTVPADVQAALTTLGKRRPLPTDPAIDLSFANLGFANLNGADLTNANLNGADLTNANLDGANLTGAGLTVAGLYGASLTNADLGAASLTGANLNGADLTGANLTNASLTNASLAAADLNGADLTNANLHGAKLPYANLGGANLNGANLTGVWGLPPP
ncbi:pentapeptide repeat-containing protein [Saccharopolyspora sp. HNM0986]|nr:pentapeptide repeat-containing protein [Saccharopolyspora sp. HNM0986]